MENDPKNTVDTPEASPKRRPLLLLLGLMLVAALAWMLWQTNRLNLALRQANDLLAREDYARALDAYTRLREDEWLRFLPYKGVYIRAGEDGAAAAAEVIAQRKRAAEALAAEQAAREAEARRMADEARQRQALLEAALQARLEGRLTEARDLAARSGLQPELVDEIDAEILRRQGDSVAARAQTALERLDLVTALSLLEQVADETARAALRQQLMDGWARQLPRLQALYGDSLCAGAWYSLALGETPRLTGDRRYEGLEARFQRGDTVVGGLFSWMRIRDGRVELIGDTLGAARTVGDITDAVGGALGLNHGLILHGDGTVTPVGAGQYGRSDAAAWTGIAAVAAGAFHSLGLRKDGTVVAAGLDLDGQCEVNGWTDVVSVAAGLRHSVALTRDGHVLAAGDNSCGQCDVSRWEHIVDVRCGGAFTLGLTAEGQLLAAGDNGCGQCDVSAWAGVVAFDGGLWHTVALLQDGRVVTAGADGHDRCALQGTRLFETGYELDLSAASPTASGEIVYTGDAATGPWLYAGDEGAVIVTYDQGAETLKVTRADLICTYGHPPIGIFSGGGDSLGDRVHATKLARQNHAVLAVTGDYFTYRRARSGLQIRRGRIIREKLKERGFSFFPDGSMGLVDPNVTTAQDLLSQGILDSWVFGPVLIENGEAQNIRRHPLARNGELTTRTVMASYCPYHHLAATYGGFIPLKDTVNDLLSCGCEVAYNLDGGRSSIMVFMGEVVTRTPFLLEGWRGLRDMVGFLTSDLVPKP